MTRLNNVVEAGDNIRLRRQHEALLEVLLDMANERLTHMEALEVAFKLGQHEIRWSDPE